MRCLNVTRNSTFITENGIPTHNCDYLPSETVQPAMRAFLEEFSENCAFVLTCNFPRKIIDPLHSRLTQIDFSHSSESKKEMMLGMTKRIFAILEDNNVDYEPKAVAALVKNKFPNFRRMLNDLQRYSVSGKIDTGILVDVVEANYSALVDALAKKKFNAMREWVASQSSVDILSVSNYLTKNEKSIVKQESRPQMILTIGEYQYRDAFMADKEMNLAAMLTALMIEVEFMEN